LFTIAQMDVSARDLFLFFGGAFLIWKSTDEIHQDVMNEPIARPVSKRQYSSSVFRYVILQIALLDVIFSLDSVLTAVGLTSQFWVMALAITIAILIMIYASEPVSYFIHKHPTIKMLALSYLILIGTVLIADSFAFHIPRGYLYFAMAFSLSVETLNLLRSAHRKRKKTIQE
jgi:predicted tellurium resistance membrane protein TerC